MTTDLPRDAAPASFNGTGGTLFWLLVRTTLLTVLTLGIYRFWARTKVRQYYWSSTAVDGSPLEYTGTGLEKFLGFLIAIVVVALYLAVVQGVLYVMTLSYFDGNPFAPSLTFLALLPLIFFAQYRGRRYIMSRTRFRGIRFAMEPGAGQFVLKAIGHTLITIITLGLLLPRQEWKLDQYMARRTYFGTARMEMADGWKTLMKPWLLIYLIAAIGVGSLILSALQQSAFGAIVFFLSYLVAIFAFAHYYTRSFALRTGAKSIGDIPLANDASSGRVIGIWVLGIVLISVIFTVIGFAVAFLGMALLGSSLDFAADGLPVGLDNPALIAVTAVLYLLTFVVMSVLTEVLIIKNVIAHFVQSTVLRNLAAFDHIAQNRDDSIADAEGFADALDMGAAF